MWMKQKKIANESSANDFSHLVIINALHKQRKERKKKKSQLERQNCNKRMKIKKGGQNT